MTLLTGVQDRGFAPSPQGGPNILLHKTLLPQELVHLSDYGLLTELA